MEACSPIYIGLLGANNPPFDIVGLGHDQAFLLRRWTDIGKLLGFVISQGIVVIVELINNPLERHGARKSPNIEYWNCRARKELAL